MSTAVIIPARYASTRLPGKPLRLIAGKPMIQHVYERASACRSIDSVLVATDDERIAAAVEAFGGRAVMTSRECRSGSDRVAEVAARLNFDIVVNLQGDEPLISPATIEAVARALAEEGEAQVATAAVRISSRGELRNPNVVKVVADLHGYAIYFSRLPIPYQMRRGAAPPFKHLGIYAYRSQFLQLFAKLPPTPLELAESLEQLRILEHGYKIRVVEVEHDSPGVDTEADLRRVRRLLSWHSVRCRKA